MEVLQQYVKPRIIEDLVASFSGRESKTCNGWSYFEATARESLLFCGLEGVGPLIWIRLNALVHSDLRPITFRAALFPTQAARVTLTRGRIVTVGTQDGVCGFKGDLFRLTPEETMDCWVYCTGPVLALCRRKR